MLGFLWILYKFIRSIIRSLGDPEFRALVILVWIMLAVGTLFYSRVEGWSLFNSFYVCVVTLTTIGYGDFTPQTVLGKAFTIVYVIVGIGILLGFIDTIAGQPGSEIPVLRRRTEHRQAHESTTEESDQRRDQLGDER